MADMPLQDGATQIVRLPLGDQQGPRIQVTRGFTQEYGTHDQTFVNCYPIATKDPFRGDTTTWDLVSRYGLNNPADGDIDTPFTNKDTTYPIAVTSLTMLPFLTIIAYYDSTSDDILIYEYDINDGNLYLVDTIAGTWADPNVYITEVDVAGVCNIFINCRDATQSESWYAPHTAGTFAGASLTQVVDVNYPSEVASTFVVGPAVQLNSYVFVLGSDNKIYNCDLHADGYPLLGTWDADGNVEVTSQPDEVRRIIRYKHHIVAMGSSSIEFFNFDPATVAPESPLSPTDQAYIGFGLVGTNAVVSVDDTLYWVASSKDSALGLWKLDGYTPVMVSDYYHNAFLQKQLGDVNLQVMQAHGMRHLVTNVLLSHNIGYLPAVEDPYAPDNIYLEGVLCYCIDTKAWWIICFEEYTKTSTAEFLFCRNVASNYQLCWISVPEFGTFPTTGNPEYEATRFFSGYDCFREQDSTTLWYYRIPVCFFSNVYDFDTTNRKTISRMKLVGDVLHDNNPPIAGGQFALETLDFYLCNSWHDYAYQSPTEWNIREITWTFPGTLGAEGAGYPYTSLKELRVDNLGHARKWKFAIIGNFWSPVRWRAIELTVRKGIH